jgi:capsular polysaccharide biosynthesis protein
MLAFLYRQYIANNLSPARLRKRLIFVQRTKLRKFLQQRAVEAAMKRVAKEYQLTYTLFDENILVSFLNTMALFNEAVMIVGPHGAGMLNMIFSEPGTFVVEGVCNIPHLNLCFQRLAHVLGHRYHGIASSEGCMKFIDVPAEAIDAAVRKHLDVWKRL